MAVQVVNGYKDSMWDVVKDMFYANFNPDDWDYIVMGYDEQEVREMAQKMTVCDNDVKQIGVMWVAVTYHS